MKTITRILLAILVASLTACGLITPDCTAEDHTWSRWTQPIVRGRAYVNDYGEALVRRRCANCGWVQERKLNPCDL